MRKQWNIVSDAGTLMIEALAMLALISMVTPILYKKAAERTLELQDINAASQMRVMSKAVDDYIRDNFADITGGRTVVNNCGGTAGSVDYSGFVDGGKPKDEASKVIPVEHLCDYLPYGFDRTEEYTTLIYCLDRDSTNLSAAVAGCGGGGVSCCSNPKAITYLVTFGCIPSRWRNLISGKPDGNLLKAIEHTVGVGTDFGYATQADANLWRPEETVKSTMAIRGREVTYTSIPQYIISNELSGVGSKSFSKMCVNNKDCPYCLIYMTPYM